MAAVPLKLEPPSEKLGGLVQPYCWVPAPEFQLRWVWGGTREPAFLTSSQAMLTLQVQGQH